VVDVSNDQSGFASDQAFDERTRRFFVTNKDADSQLWPSTPTVEVSPTVDYVHRIAQIAGKYSLEQVYEPNWGNIALVVTGRGFTTPTLIHEGSGGGGVRSR
jgi:hypothetical protein